GYGADSQQGLCVGIKLNANQQNNIAGGWQAGQANLSQLFAKSYEIWSWELDKTVTPPVMRYVQKFGTATTTDYEWDITNTGNPPKVTDIWVDNKSDKDFFIISQGSAILKFGSWIDPNQLPMVSYSVAWGDGTVVSESGLRINGRDMTNPHILVHYYKYDPDKCNPDLCTCSASYCSYQPKVTVEDNWGKTGSGTFANEIIVYKDEESMPPAILDVAPNKLVYYDKPPIYTLPYTQSFEVTNANNVGRVLNWTADLINWWQSADYTISPTSGSLGRGESQTVKLTINGSHGLATENYSGTVKIKTTDIDNQQEKDVAVTLAVDKDMVVSPTLLMLRPKKNAISTKPGSVDSKTFAIYNNTDDAVVWTATPTILAGETTPN
ncbi:hypothetical protein COW86_02335, partial [Candidatus Kuenenbacteria bacterium CG22_combo_CG10-13_8_21_14_all_39_9]